MNINAKTLNKILANWIQQNIKRSYTMISKIYPRYGKKFQYLQINQRDTPHYKVNN